MNIRSIVKDNKGQVLLMVIITSTIALLIVTGVFLRVLKLSRRGVEMETHEAAFSTAEKYARMILDELETGSMPDVSGWAADDTAYPDLISAEVETINEVNGFPLLDGNTFEISGASSGSVTTFSLDSNSWSNARILFTTVYYYDSDSDGKEDYTVKKRIYENCGSLSNDTLGDLAAVNCSTVLGNDVFTYTHQSNEVSVRVKIIGDDLSFNISSDETLFNEYLLTTDVEGTLSEASLKVSANKSMSPLFDHVLYNGEGQINK